MRTAKVTVKNEVGIRRPIRVHLTITEANRLCSILGDTPSIDTQYEIDTCDFYSRLGDAIEEATQ